MESRGLSSTLRRVLYITLFVVPFLLGMALIFMGKGLGTLPILHKIGEESYYAVPEMNYEGSAATSLNFNASDSAITLFTLHQKENKEIWEKHIMYVSKILKRYNNVTVHSVFETDSANSWSEDPKPFMDGYKKWDRAELKSNDFDEVIENLKLYEDSITGTLPYVIVDKASHIRAYCAINDLKKARDVPKMLKILNNQYAPRKVEITNGRDK